MNDASNPFAAMLARLDAVLLLPAQPHTPPRHDLHALLPVVVDVRRELKARVGKRRVWQLIRPTLTDLLRLLRGPTTLVTRVSISTHTARLRETLDGLAAAYTETRPHD